MKKRLLATTAIFVAVGTTVVTLALLPPRPGITKANFDRLEKSMNQAEVESAFGCKAHWTGQLVFQSVETGHLVYSTEHNWRGTDGFAFVEFNEGGRIDEMAWVDQPTSFYQKLQRWLPWLPD